MGLLPQTTDGNEYIMVVADYFTKWTEAYALPEHLALTVADKLVNEFICRLEHLARYILIKAVNSNPNYSKHCVISLESKKTRTTPYRPQSDGLVERFNRTLQNMLAVFVNHNRNDWDDHLPYLLMAYRSSEHESTKFTPNKLMIGREISCPINLMFESPPGTDDYCRVEYVEWLKTQ